MLHELFPVPRLYRIRLSPECSVEKLKSEIRSKIDVTRFVGFLLTFDDLDKGFVFKTTPTIQILQNWLHKMHSKIVIRPIRRNGKKVKTVVIFLAK